MQHFKGEVGNSDAVGLHRGEPGVVELRGDGRVSNLPVVVARLDQSGTEADERASVDDRVDDWGLVDELGHAADEDRSVPGAGQVERRAPVDDADYDGLGPAGDPVTQGIGRDRDGERAIARRRLALYQRLTGVVQEEDLDSHRPIDGPVAVHGIDDPPAHCECLPGCHLERDAVDLNEARDLYCQVRETVVADPPSGVTG